MRLKGLCTQKKSRVAKLESVHIAPLSRVKRTFFFVSMREHMWNYLYIEKHYCTWNLDVTHIYVELDTLKCVDCVFASE